MAESAVEQIMTLLRDTLTTAGLTATIMERDKDNPIQMAEMPFVALAWRGSEASNFDAWGTERHVATIMMDCHVRHNPLRKLHFAAQELAANALKALYEDRQFGGKVENIRGNSLGGMENIGKDQGSVSVELEVIYHTPSGDWLTLIDQ